MRTRRGNDDGIATSSTLMGLPLWVLVLLAIAITVVTYSFPSGAGSSTVQELEQEVWHELSKLYQQHQPPVVVDELYGQHNNNHGDNKATSSSSAKNGGRHSIPSSQLQLNEASRKMLQQNSRWVDGEKKLKLQLTKLARLQSEGKLLGTPALTRYLGDDFPAWVDEGADKEQWEKRVADKYAEMRQAEVQWNAQMEALIEEERQRG